MAVLLPLQSRVKKRKKEKEEEERVILPFLIVGKKFLGMKVFSASIALPLPPWYYTLCFNLVFGRIFLFKILNFLFDGNKGRNKGMNIKKEASQINDLPHV